jgi:hypothetical protein
MKFQIYKKEQHKYHQIQKNYYFYQLPDTLNTFFSYIFGCILFDHLYTWQWLCNIL